MQLKLLGAALALAWGTANAGTIIVGGVPNGANGKTTGRAGACSVLFQTGATGAAQTANTCGATYYEGGIGSFAPLSNTHVRTTSAPGIAAQPAGDTTPYFTVGPTDGSPIHIALSTPSNYFGFYAGSLDLYNTVQFYLGGVLVDSFTGAQINAVAFPGQPTDGDQAEANYIDYFPTSLFTDIVYSSTLNAFETDSHAFGIVSIPEPESMALLGLGALAALAARRRKAKA